MFGSDHKQHNIATTKQADCYHHAACLSSGPQTLPKRVQHTVPSSGPPFQLHVSSAYLGSFSSFLRPLLRLPITYIFHSITGLEFSF